MSTYNEGPLDPNSSLYKIYRYFWEHPNARIIPEEIMPVHHAVHYTFATVKNLRDGTDWPPLTLEELRQIMDEEFPNWEDNWEELSEEDYKKLGIPVPKRKVADN